MLIDLLLDDHFLKKWIRDHIMNLVFFFCVVEAWDATFKSMVNLADLRFLYVTTNNSHRVEKPKFII